MEKKKLFLYGAAGLLLLGLIMALTNVFSVSVMGFSQTIGLVEEVTWAKIVIIILDLVAIAALLLPAFNVIKGGAKLNLLAACAAILSLIVFVIVWIATGASDEMKDAAAYGAKFGPAFTGWLLILFHAGAAVLAFLSGKE